MKTLNMINMIIAIVFTVCYAYQFLMIPYAIVKKLSDKILKKKKKAGGNDASNAQSIPGQGKKRYAVLICARNESEVIGDLIQSIKEQTYPADRIVTYVCADNCDDDTAEVAQAAGAVVYKRFNKREVGKGYAMDELMRHVRKAVPEGYDGYFVFDADNILEPDYIEQMDRCHCLGNEMITGYRNSKNYGSNWISAGYALWFMRESRYLNYARDGLHTSCAISGTGFFFSRKIAEELGGWPFHLLTEDIEFSIDRITKGEKIAFCEKAELYDEQPVSFAQSWRQRMRWARGYLQVFRKYGKDLLMGMVKGEFGCFDMSMTIMPAFILTLLSLLCNLILGVWTALAGGSVWLLAASMAETVGRMYLMLFGIGLATTVTEWRHIHVRPGEKIGYLFTFPLFVFTYIPIAVASLFHKTEWKPIEHTLSLNKLREEGYTGIRG